jgi:hypothetical protein
MTRSFANCSAEGGTMDSPGGGRFLDMDPVDLPNGLVVSDGFCPSGPSPLAVLSNLDSMMDLCCSRTDRLRCMCSRMVGSWVWKPGERTAMPASCSAIPSRAVSGVADGLEERPAGAAAMLVVRSSLRGRCRELLGRVGDEGGSFLTTILGALPEPRDLERGGGVRGIPLIREKGGKMGTAARRGQLTTWETVVHRWEFSGYSVRLGTLLPVGLMSLTFENVQLRELRWKEPRLGMFED